MTSGPASIDGQVARAGAYLASIDGVDLDEQAERFDLIGWDWRAPAGVKRARLLGAFILRVAPPGDLASC